MVYYTIYKTINTVNGKFYIGKHKTRNPLDDYLGSGKWLKRAIEKHGRDKFTKKVLFILETEEEMNFMEAQLVDGDLVDDPMCYNLKQGGEGGSDKGRKLSDDARKRMSGRVISEEARKNLSESLSGRKLSEETLRRQSESKSGKNNPMYGTMYITDGTSSLRISKEQKIPEGWWKGTMIGKMWITDGKESRRFPKGEEIPDGWWVGRKTGRIHTEDHRRKISESKSGERNPNFGTMWITDGVTSRMISKRQEIPEGWRRGRK